MGGGEKSDCNLCKPSGESGSVGSGDDEDAEPPGDEDQPPRPALAVSIAALVEDGGESSPEGILQIQPGQSVATIAPIRQTTPSENYFPLPSVKCWRQTYFWRLARSSGPMRLEKTKCPWKSKGESLLMRLRTRVTTASVMRSAYQTFGASGWKTSALGRTESHLGWVNLEKAKVLDGCLGLLDHETASGEVIGTTKVDDGTPDRVYRHRRDDQVTLLSNSFHSDTSQEVCGRVPYLRGVE